MTHPTQQVCQIHARGHVLHHIQFRLAIESWKREGQFTAGRILYTNEDGIGLSTAAGVLTLFNHRPENVRHAVAEHGPDAVYMTQGVLLLLGAEDGPISTNRASFSVARADQKVPCHVT